MKGNVIMKEKISALADGELSEFETRRVLEEISSQEIQRVLTETNTEYARQVLKDSFNFDSSNNNEET